FGLIMRQWAADYYFKKSLNQQDFVVTEKYLQRAIKLNPNRFNYQVAVAKYYKERAIATMGEKDRSIDMVKSDIGNSIYWAKSAIKQAPYSVVAYETLGAIYRDLSIYIQGDNTVVIDTFKQAVSLEPSNPVLASELGNAYLSKSLYDEAIRAFQYSFNLRNDNYDAIFGMAKAMIALKQDQEAMNLLKELEKKYPSADVYYEEGKILFNLKNYEAAIVKFQQVIGVSPLHANALYSLGLSLEANGEKEGALHYYKKVLELNPGNEEVKAKIEGIEKQ
ncbi:MAG: tetratricopeptide repeat protein, partial [Candidatus Magasanikbacteria bacterium]|nr:tetratricopeptide repeat protein [Candidatus Magasanikbacteria bacterium]